MGVGGSGVWGRGRFTDFADFKGFHVDALLNMQERDRWSVMRSPWEEDSGGDWEGRRRM